MSAWTLILYVQLGYFGGGPVSQALTSVPNFKTEDACEIAGKRAAKLVTNTTAEARFVCIKVK